MTEGPSLIDAVRSCQCGSVTYVGDFDLRLSPVSVTQEVRSMCEQNLCGNYGRNWCCPPNVPPCDICRLILCGYDRAVVIRTTFPRKDMFDIEEMMSSMKTHNDYARTLRKKLQELGFRFKLLSAGGCGFCKTCSCPDNECRFPEERLYSIESYGIDLTSFLMANGIERRAGSEQSYFIMVFYKSTGQRQSTK